MDHVIQAGRLSSYERAGLRFEVTDAGPEDGPVVVLLHGFPQRATCWARVAARLNADGLRTLALDQRGYSPQARPRSRSDYTMPHLVADVVELIDLAGGPVHLVGHDWGAAVAWALAGHHPERVRSLVTVSVPHPRAYARSLFRSTQVARSWYMAAFQVPLLPEVSARTAPRLVEGALRRSGMPEDALARFRREMIDGGALGPALGWYRAIPLGTGRSARMPVVRVPTTHVWSDADATLSRRGALLTADHVEATYRLVILEGVSHWIPDEVPEQLAALIEHRVTSTTPGA
jgi:pimeloyl-ACP methyl ester carboxylesterase